MLRSFVVLTVAVLLAACASKGKEREIELEKVAEWLPGDYDNTGQVEEDLKALTDVHPSTVVKVVPVWARFVGDRALYVERIETRNGMRSIASRHLYSFEKSTDEKTLVQTTFEFKDPDRWAGAATRPDIFKSLLMDDVTATTACNLLWTFDGKLFTGIAGRKGCTIRRMEFDGLWLRMELSGTPAGDMLRLKRTGAEE
jgi:hypothetical protein